MTAVHSELRYRHCNQIFTVINVAHAFLTPLIKNTVGAIDWFLFWVLHTGPRKCKPRTSGIGAFRESHGTMPSAGSVVVAHYRTHLHVIQSNAPKLLKLHPPFISFSQASAFRHNDTKAFRYRPTKIFLYCLLETSPTTGTIRPFSIKSLLK